MDSSDNSARAVAAIARIDAVPTLLKVLCEITGMRVAVVARVTDKTWTACAVKDEAHFGLKPGMEIQVNTMLCFDSRTSRAPIVIEHASSDPRYCNHEAPKRYQIEFAALIASQLDHQSLQAQEHRALLDERAAGELREQFIAILGHDLRNPLHAVYASGDMLERRLIDPQSLALVSRIKTSARRMSALIDDVLDFARGRLGGGIGLELTEVENINTGLATVVQELRDAHPECEIISDISVNRAVRCDLGRLQQVASNLLANALTHGLPHSPVKITARADENDLVLEVWKAGEPIPPESLGKIFEPFWRHSVSRSRNGLGLGLHICSQIVRAHAGQITVLSTKELGTQFTVRLPLRAQTVQLPRDAAPPVDRRAPEDHPRRRRRGISDRAVSTRATQPRSMGSC
jgi:signal transduction histidine kinase